MEESKNMLTYVYGAGGFLPLDRYFDVWPKGPKAVLKAVEEYRNESKQA